MRIEGVIIVSTSVLFSINGMVTNLKSGNKSYFHPANSNEFCWCSHPGI